MIETLNRVECYDISNFAGKEAVGAMTVLVKHELGIKNYEWVADKSQWRKFKIKTAPTRDDPRMIAEVLERRLNHPEWQYPDLIIIDGGVTQYRAAKKVLDKFLKHNPNNTKKYPNVTNGSDNSDKGSGYSNCVLVAYPKPQKKIIGWPNAPEEIKKLAERAIYQTHNFVIRYHRQKRAKEFLGVRP
jgi:excinuclease UvrABC nuclease subunit